MYGPRLMRIKSERERETRAFLQVKIQLYSLNLLKWIISDNYIRNRTEAQGRNGGNLTHTKEDGIS